MARTTTEHQYWEARSRTYDEDSSYIVGDELSDDIKGWLQRQLTGTEAVLELGCGTGTFSEAIAPVVTDLIVTDMSEAMLDRARTKLGGYVNVRFEQQDAYETSFDDAAFDAAVIVNLLHIVHHPELVLQECNRVLKWGGRVVIADVTSQGTPLLAGMRLGLRYIRRWGRPPAANQNLSLDDLVRLAEAAGFVVKDGALVGSTVKAACVTGVR